MSFDPLKEKENIYNLLGPARHEERQFNKKQLFEKAVQISLDEVNEIYQYFHQFLDNISHLVVYQEMLQKPLTENMDRLLKELKHLMEKTYTPEELNLLPMEVYNQVLETQKQRVELLKKIAKVYLQGQKLKEE